MNRNEIGSTTLSANPPHKTEYKFAKYFWTSNTRRTNNVYLMLTHMNTVLHDP